MIDKQRMSSWKVLVVDDDLDSLEVVLRVLSFYDVKVYTATNGAEGLALAREVKPTFILSDLSMPTMDGWEMLYHLQDSPHTADIPIIALTAHGMSGDRERAIGAGFHHYLLKPLSPLTFLNDLLNLFAEQPVTAHQDPLGVLGPADHPPHESAEKDGSGNE